MQSPHHTFSCPLLLVCGLASLLITSTLAQEPRPVPNPLPAVIPGEPRFVSPPTPAATPAVFGTITGRVLFDSGKPAAGFTVCAFSAVFPFERYDTTNPNAAITDSQGRYIIRLRRRGPTMSSGPIDFNAKGFFVFVSNGGQPYIEPPTQNADPDAQPNHKVTGVDFILRLGPLVIVRARDAITGTPNPGIRIQFQSNVSVELATGVTGTDGTLRLRVPITYLCLRAELPDTLKVAPGHGSGSSVGWQIKASPGQKVVWDIKTYSSGIRFNSTGSRYYAGSPDSNWHGVVLGPNGKPVPGALVRIDRSLQFPHETKTLTDAQGWFSISMGRLEDGEDAFPYRPSIFAEKGDLRAWLFPTPDQTWKAMRLYLVAGQQASITGQAVDPAGHPLPGVPIIYEASPGPENWQNGGLTQADGHFTLTHLVPQVAHLLRFGGWSQYAGVPAHGPESFGETLVPEQPNRQYGVGYSAPLLTLQARETRDVGQVIVYPANKVVSGQILTQAGLPPAEHVSVVLRGQHTQDYPELDASGRFRDTHVADEPLTLGVYFSLNDVYNTTPNSPDLLAQMPVRAGQEDVRLIIPPVPAPTSVPTTPPKQ